MVSRKVIAGIIIAVIVIGGIIYAEVEFEVFSFLIFLQQQQKFIDDQIPLTAFQKETLDNDCLSNEIFRLAGCKYDLQNDPRGLSLMIQDRDPFNQFDIVRSEFTLSGDCIGSTFRNVDVQIGLHVDFFPEVIDECKSRITFDSFDWGLKIVDGIHNFVRVDTEFACVKDPLQIPTFSSIAPRQPCLDANNDGVPDGGYDELQAECQGILGVDCPLGLSCEFRESFRGELIAIESTCVKI